MSKNGTPGPWRLEPTSSRKSKFFVLRDVYDERGHWAGLEFIKHQNRGARHFPDESTARAAIAALTKPPTPTGAPKP